MQSVTGSSSATGFLRSFKDTLRKEQVVKGVLAAAELVGSTEFVVVGSQAIHGTVQDPPIDAVARSIDVDIFPTDYDESMFIPLHSELGYDSEFFETQGFYVEVVRPTLPRLPDGWRERARSESVGSTEHRGKRIEVIAVFPEIHDLVLSKIAVGRAQDREFFDGVVSIGLVNRKTLEARLADGPRLSSAQKETILEEIDRAFAR